MCGIAGAVGWIDGRVLSAVERMSGALVHRGPDAHGAWCSVQQPVAAQGAVAAAGLESNGGTSVQGSRDTYGELPRGVRGFGCALVHRRLSIIDTSDAGTQPMVDERTGNAMTFNGEIYNYGDIRSELEQRGVRFHSSTDSEVLLHAFGLWGEAALERFRGMFVFAIWDAEARRVVLVRDRLGIKPLYYTIIEGAEGRSLLFASEVRAILASGLVPHKLSRTARDTFLWHGFVVGEQSIIEGVHLLDAGSVATMNLEGDIEQRRFWSLPSGDRPNATNTDALRHELQEAVRLRLIADVPLGIFLSGGIDSSAVAALAMKEGRGRVQTFNISFDEAEYDESSHARAVAQRLGTEHHDIRLTQDMFCDGLQDALAGIDQPTFDAINSYFVSRAVREAGMTVALAGTGGDELFGGYRSFADIPGVAQWAKAMRFAPEGVLRPLADVIARLKTGPAGAVPPQTRWGKLADVLMTRGDLLELYQLSYALYTPAFLRELTADHDSDVAFGLTMRDREAYRKQIDCMPMLSAISRLELESFITQRLLRDTDCASMAVSLEARVPLLDHRVVEEADRLDPRVRYQPLGRKQLLRELAMPELDASMFDRPKSGFVLPIERWAREALQKQMNDTLMDQALCASVGLNGDAVARLWRAYVAGSPGLYWSRVWAIYVLLWWCREHGVSL